MSSGLSVRLLMNERGVPAVFRPENPRHEVTPGAAGLTVHLPARGDSRALALTAGVASGILSPVRRPLKRALALGGLLAFCSSSMMGWSVALHLATDDHHGAGSSHH